MSVSQNASSADIPVGPSHPLQNLLCHVRKWNRWPLVLGEENGMMLLLLRNCVLALRARFWFLLLLYESRMSVCYRSVMALESTVKIWVWCCTMVSNAVLWGLSSFPFHSYVLDSIQYAHSCVSVASSSFLMWIQSSAQVCYSTYSLIDTLISRVHVGAEVGKFFNFALERRSKRQKDNFISARAFTIKRQDIAKYLLDNNWKRNGRKRSFRYI